MIEIGGKKVSAIKWNGKNVKKIATTDGKVIWQKSYFPDRYKECEYIENTNKAFINTEVQGGSNCAYEITFLMRNAQTVKYPQIITNKDSPSFAKICLVANKIQLQYPNEKINIGEKEEKISVVANSKEYIVNGKTTAKEASISWGDYDVYLLSENPLSAPPTAITLYCRACIYMCKMYTDDVLVRDFVPVYKISSSEYGLYDKVNQKFYGSANDNKFTGKIIE